MKSGFKHILLLTLILASASLFAQYKLEVKIPTEDKKGKVLLGLFNGPDLYLEEEGMIGHCVEEAKSAFATCTFEDLPAGNYSVAMLHDLNGNRKMDFNFIGWPKEGYGFFPDPGFMFRKPRFDECNFELKRDMSVELRVR